MPRPPIEKKLREQQEWMQALRSAKMLCPIHKGLEQVKKYVPVGKVELACGQIRKIGCKQAKPHDIKEEPKRGHDGHPRQRDPKNPG